MTIVSACSLLNAYADCNFNVTNNLGHDVTLKAKFMGHEANFIATKDTTTTLHMLGAWGCNGETSGSNGVASLDVANANNEVGFYSASGDYIGVSGGQNKFTADDGTPVMLDTNDYGSYGMSRDNFSVNLNPD